MSARCLGVERDEMPDDGQRHVDVERARGFDRQRFVIGDAGPGQRRRRRRRRATAVAEAIVATASIVRSATPRAVVNFTPTTVTPSHRRGVIEDLRRRLQIGPAALADDSPATMPRCTSVTSPRVSFRAGNATFASAMNASTSAVATAEISRLRRRRRTGWCRRAPGRATARASASGRPGAGAASAMSLAGFDVTRFIALSSGNGTRDAEQPHDVAGARRRRRSS